MADKSSSKRKKKPVSQKRVAVVLASLVGTMTISAAVLLMLEGGALGTAMGTPLPVMAAANSKSIIVPNTPLRPNAWRFIIIYESGDLTASADSLADGRFTGGPSPSIVRPKANFHFVIDSAESGMDGGQQAGTSWENQTAGAPFARWPEPRSNSFTPYTNAIGICLTADLRRKPISPAQQLSLLNLVRDLQAQSNIPPEQVKFQWEIGPDPQPTPAQLDFARKFRESL